MGRNAISLDQPFRVSGSPGQTEDERFRQEVAIKFVRSGRAADESARRRFEREVQAAYSLNQPGCVGRRNLTVGLSQKLIANKFDGSRIRQRVGRRELMRKQDG